MIKIQIEGKAFAKHQVLGKIDFEIPDGETVALHGPSGIGKTTLLNIITGIDRAFEGHVKAPANVSMVFQEPTLLPWRTALHNITLITGIDHAAAAEALEMLQLSDKADHYPGQLSLGQQRRLSLARAFATKPDFLVMDEPFASLDPELVEEMLAITGDLIRKHATTALLVTHSPSEAEALADRIYQLQGEPAQLAAL